MRNFITYITIYKKSYLNLTNNYLNSPLQRKGCLKYLAVAVFNFAYFKLKKNINKILNHIFLTVTVIPSSILTVHFKESPNSNSNNFRTSLGITDLIELGPPLLNFVVYSKIGIPPFLLFMYYIVYFLKHINLPFKIIKKGHYNNLYIV